MCASVLSVFMPTQTIFPFLKVNNLGVSSCSLALFRHLKTGRKNPSTLSSVQHSKNARPLHQRGVCTHACVCACICACVSLCASDAYLFVCECESVRASEELPKFPQKYLHGTDHKKREIFISSTLLMSAVYFYVFPARRSHRTSSPSVAVAAGWRVSGAVWISVSRQRGRERERASQRERERERAFRTDQPRM